MLETAFTGGAGLHDYLGIPEIVEDIAICCGQRLGIDLATRFRESSVPCIVKFRTQEARRGLLKTALVYVHTIETGAEVGFGCNDGYATNGEPILLKTSSALRWSLRDTAHPPMTPRSIALAASGTRHNFDTRATQNDAKQRQALRVHINAMTWGDASFRQHLRGDDNTQGADS